MHLIHELYLLGKKMTPVKKRLPSFVPLKIRKIKREAYSFGYLTIK